MNLNKQQLDEIIKDLEDFKDKPSALFKEYKLDNSVKPYQQKTVKKNWKQKRRKR